MQVLSLTPEQINGLAEPERAAINQLVRPPPFMRMTTDGSLLEEPVYGYSRYLKGLHTNIISHN